MWVVWLNVINVLHSLYNGINIKWYNVYSITIVTKQHNAKVKHRKL